MILLNEVVGIGAFIHSVCVCNNLDPKENTAISLSHALVATASFAIFFKMYYVSALLWGLSQILLGFVDLAKETVRADITKRNRPHQDV